MPAGPGAGELTEFFAHVDHKLGPTVGEATGSPRVQRNDREVLNLLSKRAKTLHLGTANFCWFTDPSRALCLKLAGTPHADRPLAGMCDSARCPQATHHPCHRPVWADHAARTISAQQRQQNETRIRTAMDRRLRGEIPPGGKCDITTLAQQTGIDRTAFYGTRPYTHLREEFETRLTRMREAGAPADPP